MADAVRPLLVQVVDIHAPVDRVWDLVSDVCRMPEWSPSVVSTRLRDGFERVELGTQFTNRNTHGELTWTTHAEVVRFEPGRALAFRVDENWATWSFTLTPTASGTLLTQRRETPEGISELSRELTDGFMGGQDAYSETLLAGMRETLDRIRAAAEDR
jgi:uncharacterized protein YndB with AHSA1/START domain